MQSSNSVCHKGYVGGITFEINGSNPDEIKKTYERLMIGGGTANIPLGKTDDFILHDSLIDKHGVCWILSCK